MQRNPPLSVVVAAPARAPHLAACLACLAAQREGEGLVARVIGVGPAVAAEDVPPALHGRFTSLEASSDVAEPGLWLAGMTRVETPYVAFLDALCLPDPAWAAELVAALDAGADVVGGSVEPEGLGAGVRPGAAFLCDYGSFLPPLAPVGAGDGAGIPSLPGNNVAFRAARLRAVLARHPAVGLRKSLLLAELVRDGATVRRAPGARIGLRKARGGFLETLRERFARGRVYAGLRSAGWRRRRRYARALAAPAVPPILLLRLTRDLSGKPRERGALLRELPAVLLLFGAWAAGETIGLLRGPGETTRVR